MKPKRSNPVSGRRRKVQPRMSVITWIVCGTAVVIVAVLAVRSIAHHDALIAWRSSLTKGMTATPWSQWNPAWPDLPKPPAGIVVSDWRGPYAFAADNRDRLGYIPCYCGCRREGHRSVLDCFVEGFTSNGIPIWSDHAFTCETCVNIVREVLLMTRDGMSLRDIRMSIDEHHGGMFTRSTDTPMPQ
jgi:hypothetical protein